MSIPLMVEKKITEMVNPAKHIPPQTLSLSTLDNDPYNEVNYQTCCVFKAKNVVDDDDRAETLLREASSDLLVYYYPLSGSLKRQESDRKLQLSCGGDGGGVPFTVATANVELSSLNNLENIDSDTALKFLPELHVDNDSYRPFAMQVTKFGCGGFVLGVAISHAMCDGYGIGHTMCALTELAGGKKKPIVTPVGKEKDLWGSRIMINLRAFIAATRPLRPTYQRMIRADNIRRLKGATLKEYDFCSEAITTFEVIGAYLWKSRVKALDLDRDGVTVLGFAVGIRNVVDPPLPDGYYGNAYIDIYVPLTVREIEESTLLDIVKLIKEAKRKAHDKDYLQEELANIEKRINMNITFKGKKDGFIYLTDWRNIGIFGSMDFGWSKPVNIVPVVPSETARTVKIFMQPSTLELDMVGGVQVVVALPRIAMVKFKEEMKALEYT